MRPNAEEAKFEEEQAQVEKPRVFCEAFLVRNIIDVEFYQNPSFSIAHSTENATVTKQLD